MATVYFDKLWCHFPQDPENKDEIYLSFEADGGKANYTSTYTNMTKDVSVDFWHGFEFKEYGVIKIWEDDPPGNASDLLGEQLVTAIPGDYTSGKFINHGSWYSLNYDVVLS